jgi:hypothetical protein
MEGMCTIKWQQQTLLPMTENMWSAFCRAFCWSVIVMRKNAKGDIKKITEFAK